MQIGTIRSSSFSLVLLVLVMVLSAPARAAPMLPDLAAAGQVFVPLVMKPGSNDGNGQSGTFTASVDPMAADDFSSAEFSLWIPEGVPVLRGVLVYGPGCGASSLGGEPAAERATFVRRWQMAFLGMKFVDKPGGKQCGWSRAQNSGSAAALLKALNAFAQKTNRPELAQAPLLFFGMSGGAGFAMGAATLYPERAVASFPRGLSSAPATLPAALQVPIMMSAGENDGFLAGQQQQFATYRPQGALWSLATTPNEGHTLGKSWSMALVFFDSVAAQRLPPSPSLNGPVALRPMDGSKAWLGQLNTYNIAPEASYSGDRSSAVWLPDEATAQRWQVFVRTGQ